MIKINLFYDQKKIQAIEIKGHSNFAVINHDIVCAAVTGIFQGMLNAITILFAKEKKDFFLQLDVKAGYGLFKIENSDNKELNLIAKILYYQLKTVSVQYPKFVIIKKIF